MTAGATNLPLRLDTDDIPADRRVDQWSQVMWDLCSPMLVHTGSNRVFRARVVANELGSLGLRHIVSDAYRGTQTRQTLARAKRETYMLTIATQGSFHMSQFGRDVVVDRMTATLHSTMDEVEFNHDATAGALLLSIPADLMRERLGVPEQHCARSLHHNDPAFSIACDLLSSLVRNVGQMDAPTRSTMALRMVDVLAVALEASGNDAAGGSDVRLSRLRRIKGYIDSHLADTDMSPVAIAAANDVSERYLYDLFRSEGTSPSRWISERRLSNAARALAEENFAALPISTIAARFGFRNAAHFSTLFRKRYGQTPRQARDRATASTAPGASGRS
jgi:AraC-like DNA-binding protein